MKNQKTIDPYFESFIIKNSASGVDRESISLAIAELFFNVDLAKKAGMLDYNNTEKERERWIAMIESCTPEFRAELAGARGEVFPDANIHIVDELLTYLKQPVTAMPKGIRQEIPMLWCYRLFMAHNLKPADTEGGDFHEFVSHVWRQCELIGQPNFKAYLKGVREYYKSESTPTSPA